jgi:hypothetical protein
MRTRADARARVTALTSVLGAWRARVLRSRALHEFVVARALRELRRCLAAWRRHAERMAGAALIMRRMLVGTLGGAFAEWRRAAAEQAYWRRVRPQDKEPHLWVAAQSVHRPMHDPARAAHWCTNTK